MGLLLLMMEILHEFRYQTLQIMVVYYIFGHAGFFHHHDQNHDRTGLPAQVVLINAARLDFDNALDLTKLAAVADAGLRTRWPLKGLWSR